MIPLSAFRVPESKKNISSLQSALSNRSYVVVLSFWEQLLGASRNFIHLQCWAQTLGKSVSISTVEPYLERNRSYLGFSFAQNNTLFTNISLSNLYDMNTWHNIWPHNGGALAPIVSKNTFLDELSRFEKNVILVEIKYLTANTKRCDFSWNITTLMKDLQHYHRLTVTRKVCVNLQQPLNPVDFRNLVMGSVGDLSTQNTVFIFKQWRGIGPGRTYIRLSSCSMDVILDHLRPSKEVLKDAEIYANQYLGGFGQYISVSARFEKVSLRYFDLSLKQWRHEVDLAVKESMKIIDRLKKRASLDTVYLTYDYGQFGSRTFKLHTFYNCSDLLIKFQHDVYKGRMSLNEYEQSFMTFKHRNPGYVAMVQMAISSRGKCLLRVGWGHCIEFVASLFKSNHVEPFCFECAPHNVCRYKKRHAQ